ncbi:MAG: putative membrane protein [Pseudomonas sp.]|jgi:putative membrane protein
MKKYFLLYAKGIAMGAADVVPGVSGGTVAFITGIYDELLRSLANFPQAIGLLLRGRIAAAWQAANATFLLVLLAGILTSVLSLARLITYLLAEQPIPVWSFFFGLIVVSSHLVSREIQRWNWNRGVSFACGAGFAYWITVATPMQLGDDPFTLFCAGAIAICAMILPGISGSFILVLLGLYGVVLAAVNNLNVLLLGFFASGCLLGLISFASLLRWVLTRWRDLSLAFLTGLMLGSLNKIWPWKETFTWRIDSHGAQLPLLQGNLSPVRFAELSGQDPQVMMAVALAVCGVVLVLGLEWLAGLSQRRVKGVE